MQGPTRKREFFIVKLLVWNHFIAVMIGWTGLTSWEFEFPFPGSRYIYLPRGAYELLGVNHDPLTNQTWGG